MGRALRTVMAAGLFVLGTVGAAACSDDDDQASDEEVVTEEQYAAEAQRLCDVHTAELEEEEADVAADGASDADIVSFYRVDLIPRTRAIMEGLVDFGLPPARAAEILQAFNEINTEMAKVDDDPYGYLDRTRNGDPSNEGTLDTFGAYVDERLATAEVPCLQD